MYRERIWDFVATLKDLLEPIKASVKNVKNYPLACLALHNYLHLTENAKYIPAGFADPEDSNGNIVPGDWQKDMQSGNSALEEIASPCGSRAKKLALDIRDALKDYLNREACSGKLVTLEEHRIIQYRK